MVKQGKIIVLDGLDGCGKSTQFAIYHYHTLHY